MIPSKRRQVSDDLRDILRGQLGEDLVDELLRQHARLHQRFQAGEHEGALEAVGKYAEVAIRCDQYMVSGSCVPLTASLPPFDQLVRAIEASPSGSAPESLRIIAPRVLHAVYTIRSKRRGGHVSGEVSPQRMDALLTLHMADWFLAELARVLGQLSLEEGQALVDSLVQRRIPVVYRDQDIRIVTRADLPLGDEILVLLYPEARGLTERQIVTATRTPRSTTQRAIASLVDARLTYKTTERPYRLRLLPPGAAQVEARRLLSYPEEQ
jgi:hypothetical protein